MKRVVANPLSEKVYDGLFSHKQRGRVYQALRCSSQGVYENGGVVAFQQVGEARCRLPCHRKGAVIVELATRYGAVPLIQQGSLRYKLTIRL